VRMDSATSGWLAVLAYISGIVLAVLAAAQANLRAVETVALAFVVLASASLLPPLWN